MAKPTGPACNLNCSYCFYLEKQQVVSSAGTGRMKDEVLETFIRAYIEAQPAEQVDFSWQGGEPTLAGLEFFRRAIELQQKHCQGKKVSNAFQTNGTLLDDAWCDFFAQHGFLIGLSIDGPRELHDAHRVDHSQTGSFDKVMRGLALLKKHAVDFNALTVVNRRNAAKPLQVYHFLKDAGIRYVQFIPLVEREADGQAHRLGLTLACPPRRESTAGLRQAEHPSQVAVTSASVLADQFSSFLNTIFDEWVRRDVGEMFVQLFDNVLAAWVGVGAPLCVFQERCGRAMIVESSGDVYACDHYVYPDYRIGNVCEQSLAEIVDSTRQSEFGAWKATLPACCRECEVRFICHGDCPKHRFVVTEPGEPDVSYLCPAYRSFFGHVAPYMETMAELLRRERPPALIMEMIRNKARRNPPLSPNALCPCGSGRKYKKCCGAAGEG